MPNAVRKGEIRTGEKWFVDGRVEGQQLAKNGRELLMPSEANTYVGDLILDYDDGHCHEEYSAKVTWASIAGDDWIVQFRGTDATHGSYQGEIRLHGAGSTLIGDGTFQFSRQPLLVAVIKAKIVRKNQKQATCEGTWYEPGDAYPYAMTLDLVKAGP